MNTKIEQLDNSVREFLARVHPSPAYSIREIDVKRDVLQSKDWPWSNAVGIYVFIHNDIPIYLGRALRNTLFGARIISHSNLKTYPEDHEWGNILRMDGTTLRLYTFEKESDDYWAAALELHLFDEFHPKFNLKRG